MKIYGNKSLINLEKNNHRLPEKFRQENGPLLTQNTILNIVVRTGFVGVVVYLYILLTAVFMMWHILKLSENEYYKSWLVYLLACFMSFMFSALFINASSHQPAVVFYTILAKITILWRLVQKDSQPSQLL